MNTLEKTCGKESASYKLVRADWEAEKKKLMEARPTTWREKSLKEVIERKKKQTDKKKEAAASARKEAEDLLKAAEEQEKEAATFEVEVAALEEELQQVKALIAAGSGQPTSAGTSALPKNPRLEELEGLVGQLEEKDQAMWQEM